MQSQDPPPLATAAATAAAMITKHSVGDGDGMATMRVHNTISNSYSW